MKQVPRSSARQTTVAPQLYGSRQEEPWRAYRLEDAFWPFGGNAADQRSVRWLNGRSRREAVVRSLLERITGRPFFNLARLDFAKLLERSEPARRQSQRVRSTR